MLERALLLCDCCSDFDCICKFVRKDFLNDWEGEYISLSSFCHTSMGLNIHFNSQKISVLLFYPQNFVLYVANLFKSQK